MAKRKLRGGFLALMALVVVVVGAGLGYLLTGSSVKGEVAAVEAAQAAVSYSYGNGNRYLAQYANNKSVRQIILVEQSRTAVSEATLFLLRKENGKRWQEQFRCPAYLGKNGIDKAKEGDARTPTGDYGMLLAFGIKDNPGSRIPYTKLTSGMYVCGDNSYYNQFIDADRLKHSCKGEHLIEYTPHYNYALFIDYNKEGVPGKGSAIFLHCFGSKPYTGGCVSVSEENMVRILRAVDGNVRICIYPAGAKAVVRPAVSAEGFVNVDEVIPDAVLDIRYYSDYNFVGTRIDGYREPVALLTKQAAEALKKVADEVRPQGYRIKVYDAYRPQAAVDHFVRWGRDIGDQRMKKVFYPEVAKENLFVEGFIATRSGHSKGSTVDLTLVDSRTGKDIDMGGPFDYFGYLSYPDYPHLTAAQKQNRQFLQQVMVRNGFRPLDTEWWHFTLNNEPYPNKFFNFPVERIKG